MGLTNSSIGADVNTKFQIDKTQKNEKIIALAGNPNVGKSTVFNALTGLKQHTGNWTGKTVSNAKGEYKYKNQEYIIVDVPGTYSLMASSVEEEVARDFICFGDTDAVVIVLDGTCLERNLNLALQILEISSNVSVCVNLIDEAEKKGISVDFDELSLQLGADVTGICARRKKGLSELKENILKTSKRINPYIRAKIKYCDEIEKCISELVPEVEKLTEKLSP
ncbi:MAG: ferrous iron transporter B, partial [Clostridiales bacterium]|nr:ferrous iron transporter B [Clostridiales bacterium]